MCRICNPGTGCSSKQQQSRMKTLLHKCWFYSLEALRVATLAKQCCLLCYLAEAAAKPCARVTAFRRAHLRISMLLVAWKVKHCNFGAFTCELSLHCQKQSWSYDGGKELHSNNNQQVVARFTFIFKKLVGTALDTGEVRKQSVRGARNCCNKDAFFFFFLAFLS